MTLIRNETLTDLDGPFSAFAGAFLTLQAELEVAVFAGTGTVVVSWGDKLTRLAGPPPAAESLPPIDTGLFEGVVTDLHLSSLFVAWTAEHEGALRLRAVFEEEGVELRGGLADVDLDHLQLDVFMVPSLDETNTVMWDVQLGFEIDGGLISDLARGEIEKQLLDGPVVGLIAESLQGFTDQLNGLLGLPEGGVASIDIDDDEAIFGDVPGGAGLYDVIFDAVEVHDDTDGSGQGELSFSATVADIDTGFSPAVSAATDTIVPLEGSQWNVSLALPEGRSLSVRFEARDEDGGQTESLGVINIDLDPDDAPLALRLTAGTGKYTLYLRVEPRGEVSRPPHTRHLRVSVPSVEVYRDHDTTGKGEVRFWALAGDQPTPVSAETKAKGSDDPEIALAAADGSSLQTELFLPEGDDLVVRVVGWDVDPGQRDWLGEARLVIPGAAVGVGDGPEEVVADSGDFLASIVIVDLDEPEDGDPGDGDPGDEEPVETVARLVVVESLTVGHDNDTIGAGEILATATANGHVLDGTTLAGQDPVPIDTSSGKVLPLVGAGWRTEVAVPVGGTLELTARVVDVDGRVDDAKQHNDDLLGTASLTLGPDEDYGLGEHVLADGDGDGDFSLQVLVLDPAAETGDIQATVRFEEVEILHDHTTIGRGAFWSTASVNGFPVGNSDRFEAGRGDSIVLDGAAWTHSLGLAAGDDLELAFEVFEADDNDHISLGTATARLGYPWPEGVQEATSDEGDFILRFSAWDPAGGGANRLRVTFLEVTVLDDGEPFSEGELHFLAGANDEQSGLSALQKARSGETLPLVGDLWTLEPRLGPSDDLTVTFTAYAEDSDALSVLDRFEQRFTLEDAWGLGEHVSTSDDGSFRVRYAIAPAGEDGLPDVPLLTPLLVEFTAVQVHDDGDRIDRGEVTFTGEVNGTTVLHSDEYKVDSGDTVLLGDPLAPRTIWLAPDQDLDVALTASERDGDTSDVLGTSRLVHSAAAGWDLGVHEVDAPGGAITATWRVDRADGPRVRVKFLQVHVYKDHEAVGRGELVCEGLVNGVSTGPSLKMKAGSDGRSSTDDIKSDLFIGGPKWRKIVSYDPDDPQLDVTFTVTELDGLSADDPLGTVTLDVTGAIDDPAEIQLHQEVKADTGRFALTFITQRLA